ncbi:hypothetical protein B5F70_05510 [Collinsella sp. An268]|nr:hypothetical protein B5F70_05510 [Collinsella sp. An268]
MNKVYDCDRSTKLTDDNSPINNYLDYEFYCNSWYYRGKPKVNERDYVRLQPEPNNKHDPFAVAIYKGSRKVGYVPKHYSRETSKAINDGRDIRVEVSCGSDNYAPFFRVYDAAKPAPKKSDIPERNPIGCFFWLLLALIILGSAKALLTSAG